MTGDNVPRIRLAAVPRDWTLVVRGDELDPDVLASDAIRFYERYPDWNRFGVSAFLAATMGEVDSLCESRLVRFATVAVFTISDLNDAGLEIVPTFRSPHVTLCHLSLPVLVELLTRCEYSLLVNRHFINEKG